jgi:hypothetical protein
MVSISHRVILATVTVVVAVVILLHTQSTRYHQAAPTTDTLPPSTSTKGPISKLDTPQVKVKVLQNSVDDLQQFIKPASSAALAFLFDSFQPEVVFSSNGNLLPIGNKLYKVEPKSVGSRLRFAEQNSCNMSTLLDVFEASQNPILPIRELYPKLSVNTAMTLSVEVPVVDRSFVKTESQLLIVYTTCNQLSMTILSLQFLRNTDKLADLLIVDDHSTDGSVEYLRKRGFSVITKPKATGLTDSWNVGYRIAVALGYKNVIFTNNDVLLTTGSIALMNQGLRDYGLVVPLTTEKGAGHHPAQVSRTANLTVAFDSD